MDPTDSESIIITSATGIKVDFPSVNEANAQGSRPPSPVRAYTPLLRKSFDFTGLTPADGESWTLMINGSSKTAVVGTTLIDSTVVTTLARCRSILR